MIMNCFSQFSKGFLSDLCIKSYDIKYILNGIKPAEHRTDRPTSIRWNNIFLAFEHYQQLNSDFPPFKYISFLITKNSCNLKLPDSLIKEWRYYYSFRLHHSSHIYTRLYLFVDPLCVDEFPWCGLVPKHNICHHSFYGPKCCLSCRRKGS